MEDIFLARQPIYDRDLNVIGYELLFRNNHANVAQFTDGARASSQLISNTFMGIGLENIVGSSVAFINLTHEFFIGEQPIPMRPEQVVLEICEETLPEEKVLTGLQQLAGQGYAIALDDFVYQPELEPLLALATYVKLDLEMHSREALREQIAQCRRPHLKLIAEKVETPKDLEDCRELGFDYFQGYFLCKPQILQGRSDTCNRSVLLQLMDRLQQNDEDIGALERILIEDVVLSYKLLRYVNCANYTFRREIDTVEEALKLLGCDTIRKWAVVLLMSNYHSEKPRELITTSLVRGRMCYLLAEQSNTLEPEQAFTVGFFSTLDAMMDQPMDELLDSVSLSSPIKFALHDRDGPLGELLNQVVNYEQGEWSDLDSRQLTRVDFVPIYLAAIQWANERETEDIAPPDEPLELNRSAT